MRRQRWFEIHDQPWFPAYFRDLVTEALETVWNQNRTYHPIAERLREAVASSKADRVVDLCSGGGGPWKSLSSEVAGERGLEICLTDLYPNKLLRQKKTDCAYAITIWPDSVDARRVPAELTGFRTIFSSFHHFDPAAARAILADAFTRREGIGIFEGARPDAWTLVAVTAMPFLAVRAALTARPFRWGRIFWSCVLPVVPAVVWVDGVLSCLRSYSLEDLQELTRGLEAEGYTWRIGDQSGGPVPIRYLIGTAA